MEKSYKSVTFSGDLEPLPGAKLSDAVQFHGTGSQTTGSGDLLHLDKTTKSWRRWVYYKNKKLIPDLCTNIYGNKLFIEKIERACLAISEGHRHAGEEYFVGAMDETVKQLSNPRSDSAEALDRLGEICLRANESSKAIACFEYSLHMRRTMYGENEVHVKILQSLVYLGNAWAQFENTHRAIIVLEKALEVAKSLSKSNTECDWKIQIAEVYHNLGTCWERLREHHTAIDCYSKAEKLRRLAATPEVCLRNNCKLIC